MPNDEITGEGLSTKTNLELIADLKEQLQNIYSPDGEEISFDSNSPDGQFVEILAEMGSVVRELATEIYNSFDPTKCTGAVQDSRYQINYLTRKVGTYTRQNIEITVNQTVTLNGLDESYADESASAYTVADDNGNLWYLIDTTTLYAGTTSCPFRAKQIGEIIPTVGTIKNQVTIVQGVTGVINDVGYTILGTEQESDADFRLRREQSLELGGLNNIDAMFSQILSLEGVTNAKIHQNTTNSTDSTGTAAHTIWVIVGGGANTEIADIIYSNLAGSDMRGNIDIPVLTASGQQMHIKFDRPAITPLYIRFDFKKTNALEALNVDDMKLYIANNLLYTIGENAETSRVTTVASEAAIVAGNNGYVLNVELSTGGSVSTSIGASTGITSASTNVITFQEKIQDTAGTYAFSYDGTAWKLNTTVVNLVEYGISYEGTPASGDTITVTYTAGTWSDVLIPANINQQFVTDGTKMYITEV